MKRIILLAQLNEKEAAEIEIMLRSSGIQCSVSLPSKAVVIEGDNDDLAVAKRVLLEAGYPLL